MNDRMHANYENYYCGRTHQNPLSLMQLDDLFEQQQSSPTILQTISCNLTASVTTTPPTTITTKKANKCNNSKRQQQQKQIDSVRSLPQQQQQQQSPPSVAATSPNSMQENIHNNNFVPFVQIHTTDVQPQRSSHVQFFRRSNQSSSQQASIKSELIKSETNEGQAAGGNRVERNQGEVESLDASVAGAEINIESGNGSGGGVGLGNVSVLEDEIENDDNGVGISGNISVSVIGSGAFDDVDDEILLNGFSPFFENTRNSTPGLHLEETLNRLDIENQQQVEEQDSEEQQQQQQEQEQHEQLNPSNNEPGTLIALKCLHCPFISLNEAKLKAHTATAHLTGANKFEKRFEPRQLKHCPGKCSKIKFPAICKDSKEKSITFTSR